MQVAINISGTALLAYANSQLYSFANITLQLKDNPFDIIK